ncbi:polyprenyl synthetase family protein [Noviherbaspirillum galbum]|uniref:Polyprenyl synthetase family protein n=1 Tax=Noviherbaspirillum galbum TaxID=2709383 RepID=A0A6B3SFH6_9BURK|nr:polyprenyl synthetase family protein [Noviherbaspirillum galbum]NEX59604.1 polyprenyl synthetase family protein [Noviherbaspirillum galbum]
MLAPDYHVSDDWMRSSRSLIDAQLERLLRADRASTVTEAMRYSVLAPGKRIRPLLTLAVAEYLGARPEGLLHVACSIEMIHAASLVLDDLPCMDNDHQRRQRPSTHAAFGEDVSILAAISLLMKSYCILASHAAVPQATRLQLIELLCDTIGANGLSLGQYIDLSVKTQAVNAGAIADVHHLKTGVLFIAAAKAGCLLCDATPEQSARIERFTTCIGLAFQLMDDLQDVADTGLNLAARIGRSNAERQFREHLREAEKAIDGERNSAVLKDFLHAVFNRT